MCGCSPVSTDNDQLRSIRHCSLESGLGIFVSVALGRDVTGAAVRHLNRSCDFHRIILVGRLAAKQLRALVQSGFKHADLRVKRPH
jgi:hypothetical protein